MTDDNVPLPELFVAIMFRHGCGQRTARMLGQLLPGEGVEEQSVTVVAMSGHLQVLRLLVELHGKKCTSVTANMAACDGRLDVVKYLHTNGIFCTSRGADLAAVNGHMDVLRFLHSHKIWCTVNGINNAAMKGYLDVIRFAREDGILGSSKGADWAAREGHVEVLCELRQCGIKCSRDGPLLASQNGHLHVIKFLNEEEKSRPRAEIEWGSNTANCAAEYGHLSVVRYLHKHVPCYCTELGAELAMRNGHFEVVDFLHNHGIMCSDVYMDYMIRPTISSLRVVQFAYASMPDGI